MARIRGTGLYVITTTKTDGTVDRWKDTSKAEAVAAARTWSLKDGYASADVHKTDGTHVGHYEQNHHLQAVL